MKGKDFTCSFDLLLAKKLLQRNLFDLDVNSTQDVWENTTNLNYTMVCFGMITDFSRCMAHGRL